MTSYLVPFRTYRRLLFKFWTKNGNFAIFSPLPLWAAWGQRTLFIVRLIGKLVVDFLFELI